MSKEKTFTADEMREAIDLARRLERADAENARLMAAVEADQAAVEAAYAATLDGSAAQERPERTPPKTFDEVLTLDDFTGLDKAAIQRMKDQDWQAYERALGRLMTNEVVGEAKR